MKLYYYLHYFTYKRYQKWRDSDPDLYASALAMFLVLCNLMLLFWLLGTDLGNFIHFKRDWKGYLVAIPMYYLHYHIVYYKDRHLKLFAELEANKEQTKRYSVYVTIYIIGSIVSTFGYAIYHSLTSH